VTAEVFVFNKRKRAISSWFSQGPRKKSIVGREDKIPNSLKFAVAMIISVLGRDPSFAAVAYCLPLLPCHPKDLGSGERSRRLLFRDILALFTPVQ
jgi:hypothetical protein